MPSEHAARGEWRELALVNLIRERLAQWRDAGLSGRRRARRSSCCATGAARAAHRRLFFAQLEAAETIIFLTEARPDFLQGIDVPLDEPSDGRKADGFKAFRRYACKMATGSGKTTVMAMLAAWSILNKVNDRADARFSDVVLVVCPNVTIRSRLGELDPRRGEASLYRTRDLVPRTLMPDLTQGRVLVTNWHVFEPRGSSVGGTGARVVKAGRPVPTTETITVARQDDHLSAAGNTSRRQVLEARVAAGDLRILDDKTEKNGRRTVKVSRDRYVESDTALVNRMLGPRGRRQAEHPRHQRRGAPRLSNPAARSRTTMRRTTTARGRRRLFRQRGDGLGRRSRPDQQASRDQFLRRPVGDPVFHRPGRSGHEHDIPVGRQRFRSDRRDRVRAGQDSATGRPRHDRSARFPATSTSGTGFCRKLTPAERGGKKTNPKPEAILKYANTPIAMLGGLWDEMRKEWAERGDETAAARLHPRLQEHKDRAGDL